MEQEIINNPQLVPLTFYLRKMFLKFLTTKKPFKAWKLGHFDDNGVLPSSLLKKVQKHYLLYRLATKITTRYSLIVGLAYQQTAKI